MRGDRPERGLVMKYQGMFTPHARGSTAGPARLHADLPVYPACAGIDPRKTEFIFDFESLPRMRGDRPVGRLLELFFQWFTPHARGSTAIFFCFCACLLVYPACAGIDRLRIFLASSSVCLPRMRGDRPSLFLAFLRSCVFTPHARGSTSQEGENKQAALVYPACAGIDLILSSAFSV